MVTRGFTGRRVDPATAARLPAGQHVTKDFPVLSASPTPQIDPGDWRFTLKHGSRPIASWSWLEFNQLPRTLWQGDIHCVTTWSKLETTWEGVSIDDLLAAAGVGELTPFVLADPDTGLTFEDIASLGMRGISLGAYAAAPCDSTSHRLLSRKLGPPTFQWACFAWRCRSTA